MYCGLSVKINMREAPHGVRRLWTHLVCIKNLNTPNWSSMADSAITWSGIGVLGSLVYICGDTIIITLRLISSKIGIMIP